jgi:hypothetical protein
MSLRSKLLRKVIGKKVGKTVGKSAMTPAKKRALAKAVKASAMKRRKGAGISPIKTKLRLNGGKPKSSLLKRKKKALNRSAKYDDKAQSVERNMQGSILKRDNTINLARRIKLGHFARKSRRLNRKSKRLANKIAKRNR